MRRSVLFVVGVGLLSCFWGVWCNGMMITGSQSIMPIKDYGVIQFFGIFTTSQGGGGTGARLAVNDINSHNLRMTLPLRVHLAEGGETGCGEKENAVAIFTSLIQTQSQENPAGSQVSSSSSSKPIILAGCHPDCIHLAQAGVEHDAITMCYGMKSNSLLDMSLSSELFMMEPEFETAVVTPLLKLIFHFGWRKVAVLSFLGDPLVQLAEIVSSVLEEHDVQVGRVGGNVETFSEQTHLEILQQNGFKVVIAVVGAEAQGRELFCGIYQAGMLTSAGYVWIFIGPPNGRQWLTNPTTTTTTSAAGRNCRPDQVRMGAEGHFILNPQNWHPDPNLRTISNRTASGFRRDVTGMLGHNGGEGMQSDLDEAPLAYDAVWAAYIAVASSMIMENGGSIFPIGVDDVNFPGVSGPVSFHEGKRSMVGVTVRVDQFKGGRYSLIAHHFNANASWAWNRPSPFGPLTPGDGYDDGQMPPLLEIPFWPPPDSPTTGNNPPPSRGGASSTCLSKNHCSVHEILLLLVVQLYSSLLLFQHTHLIIN